MSPPSNAYPRGLAVRVLTRVLSDGKTLDQALEDVLSQADAAPGARAWLQEVCAGSLRWKGRLDLAIDSTALKKKPSGWLRKALTVAAYQIIVQERVHRGAVVSETVSEIKREEGQAPSKFANACLRKISEHAEAWRKLPFRAQAPAKEAAAWGSLPEWLWNALVEDRGMEWTRAFAEACLERPTLWIRARGGGWMPEGGEAGPVAASWRLAEGGAVFEKSGFHEGEFIVQDISSQILVQRTAELARRHLGEGALRALDLCAAPGGKSVGMAWNGLSVLATDRDPARLSLLKKTLERVRADVSMIDRASVSELPPLDLVWVDAPCTGTGIIRRHPEVRWLRKSADLDALNQLQQELVREGWARVKPGGILAYSVCSVLKREGEGLIEKALNGSPAERLDSVLLDPQNAPYGDGFWAAWLRKPRS